MIGQATKKDHSKVYDTDCEDDAKSRQNLRFRSSASHICSNNARLRDLCSGGAALTTRTPREEIAAGLSAKIDLIALVFEHRLDLIAQLGRTLMPVG